MDFLRRLLLTVLALLIGAAIWLPTLHLFFASEVEAVAFSGPPLRMARELASRHVALWEDESARAVELERMRGSNAEWDFMGRTFLVLALTNMALREPDQAPRYLQVVDRIIDDTIAVEAERGMEHFLMPYAREKSFVQRPPRSIFVDGEIALMLGARRSVSPLDRYREPFTTRIETMARRLSESPVVCCECYPDEAWMFCNAVAMVCLRMSEHLDGTDHSALIGRWLETAKSRLLHRETGLLVSSLHFDGRFRDGPEGSSIWFVAHCLQVVDAQFALDQYRRARHELGDTKFGFGYAREWPRSWVGQMDVDSGPVIPILDISAGSSGMALLGASAFGDTDFLQALLRTVSFAAFPIRDAGGLRHAASNQVGDAVLLYAMCQGPLWSRIGASR